MLHFESDYMAGAHPEVLQRLIETNLLKTVGYGADDFTAHAQQLIQEACGTPQARVHFLVGGTQTNATVIDGLLARHEGVLAAESGHIGVHEAGAIEATGHKVLTLPQYDGRSGPRMYHTTLMSSTEMRPTNIWSPPECSTSPSPPSMVPSTRSRSWRQ